LGEMDIIEEEALAYSMKWMREEEDTGSEQEAEAEEVEVEEGNGEGK
jgi:hypothetical protein